MSEADRAQALAAADFIRNRVKITPRTAILTGTGLGDILDAVTLEATVAYDDIPHFPLSTVQSHHGRLALGQTAGRAVAVLQGRFHLYEGYTPRQVTFPVRVLQELGVDTLILTNASGGLNPAFDTGDIMIIEDHINMTGANPLTGANEESWGPRFPDMTDAYAAGLRRIAVDQARRLDIPVRTGVYIGLKGPSLETPAEMRFLRTIGADAVGFSTAMETIAAVHAGMRVLGLSTITNMTLPDSPQPASVDDIIAVARAAAPRVAALIGGVLQDLGETD